MATTDVQHFTAKVLLDFDRFPELRRHECSLDGSLTIPLDHDVFRTFAAQVSDAEGVSRGVEKLSVRAAEVRIGDHMLGREVINVRPDRPSTGMTSINLNPFGFLLAENEDRLDIERPIQ